MKSTTFNHFRNARGVALPVALLLLVVITILALAGLRSTTLQERMSGNLHDRNLALQAAESALRVAEEAIKANAATFDCDCAITACPIPPPGAGCASQNWRNATTSLRTWLDDPPQYYIENMGTGPGWGGEAECSGGADAYQYGSRCGELPDVRYYRITARSKPLAGRASVVLQSMFRRRM